MTAAQAAAETVAAARDYAILARPRIDAATFARVLRRGLSPAADEAAAMYEAVIGYGVDPALFLAQFAHESGYGRIGAAFWDRSTGNLRTTTLGAEVGAVPGLRGKFVAYPSWTAGARDHAALLASGLYGRSADYATARTMPYRWAPVSDGNDPAAYGADLVFRIGRLAALGGTDMAVAIHAGGLALASSYALDLPAGTPLYAADGQQVGQLHAPDGASHVTVDYFGIPAGGGWYYALVVTGAPAIYPDGHERPTLVLVDEAAAHPRPKTPDELAAAALRFGGVEVAAAVAALDSARAHLGGITPRAL